MRSEGDENGLDVVGMNEEERMRWREDERGMGQDMIVPGGCMRMGRGWRFGFEERGMQMWMRGRVISEVRVPVVKGV